MLSLSFSFFYALLGIVVCLIIFLFAFFNVLSIVLKGAFFSPSGKHLTDRMVSLVDVKPQEKALDLGSGDGSQVIALAKAGAIAYGYEINPVLVWWSKYRIYRAGLSKKAFIYRKDFWKADLSQFDVITIFGVYYMMDKLEKKLMRELKPKTRVVSNYFKFPNWKPSKQDNNVYLYVK